MKTIAIVAGGNSSEYDISVKSARSVAGCLEGRYEAYIIVIRADDWYWEGPKGRVFSIDKNDFSLILDDRKVRFDAAFIAIHGSPGENGVLQGYFDMTGIPYTSCSSFVSALTFNKFACKQFLKGYNIPMANGILLRKGQQYDPTSIIRQLGLPLFVKPNASGSSFGVTKVKKADEFEQALTVALSEGHEAMVEAFMPGREVACGVMKSRNKKIIMPVTEIIPKKEFFDFEAKYSEGMSDEITPANISGKLTAQIQEMSSEIYDILDCRGIVRVDYIVNGNQPLFLEINTVPGMTMESIIPKQAGVFGLPLPDLYSMLIEELF